jgi:serine/threonine protein phosphatase PrpC
MGLCKSKLDLDTKFDDDCVDTVHNGGSQQPTSSTTAQKKNRGASSVPGERSTAAGVQPNAGGGRTEHKSQQQSSAAAGEQEGAAVGAASESSGGRLSLDRRSDRFFFSFLGARRRLSVANEGTLPLDGEAAAADEESNRNRAHHHFQEYKVQFDDKGAVVRPLPITKQDSAAEVLHSELSYELPLEPPAARPALRLSAGVVSRTGWEPVRKGKENQDSACVLMPLVPAWTCSTLAPRGENEVAKPCDMQCIPRQPSKLERRISTRDGLDNLMEDSSGTRTFDDPEASLATVTVMTPRHLSLRHLPENPNVKGASVQYHEMILRATGSNIPPHVLSDALWAVFDGHGVAGRLCSHYIRNIVPKLLARFLYDHALHDKPAEALRRTCLNAEQLLTARGELLELEPETDAFAYLWNNMKSMLHQAVATVRENSRPSTSMESIPDVDDEDDGLGGIDSRFSGTTGIIVLLHGRELFCANVGDSRAVLGRRLTGRGASDDAAATRSKQARYYAVALSVDHKPDRPDERKRIQNLGGHVESWHGNIGPARVWLPTTRVPGLAMSRSFGDQVVENIGVIADPEIYHLEVCPADAFIVLGSDGIWEFLSSDDVVQFVGRRKDQGESPQAVAEQLVQEAVRRWMAEESVIDDTTCIVVYLEPVGDAFTDPGVCQHTPRKVDFPDS